MTVLPQDKKESRVVEGEFANRSVIKKMSDWSKVMTEVDQRYLTKLESTEEETNSKTSNPPDESMETSEPTVKTEKLEGNEKAASDNDADTKPSHSYIALIAMAILSKPSKKVLLGDIYSYISEKFPYYRSKDKSWRNSIRHNLSLNECFIKAGRSENGKGNYWAIHPANLEDFANGDFRRRRARRRVRKNHSALCTRYGTYPFQQHAFLNYRAAESYLQPYYLNPFSLPSCVRKSNFAIDNLLSSRVPIPGGHHTPVEYPNPICSTALLRAGYTPAQPYTALNTPSAPVPYPIVLTSNTEVPTDSWNDTLKKLKAQFQNQS